MTRIRLETAEDVGPIRGLNLAAFGGTTEADLVDALRSRRKLVLSLVADLDGAVVGHIAFSSVVLDSLGTLRGIGLGPMAVRPALQRRGTGSLLVSAGLQHCQVKGHDFAVVLGHPHYYPRFGFVPASRFGLRCAWDVPDDVFMAIELRTGALVGVTGLVRYEPEFNDA